MLPTCSREPWYTQRRTRASESVDMTVLPCQRAARAMSPVGNRNQTAIMPYSELSPINLPRADCGGKPPGVECTVRTQGLRCEHCINIGRTVVLKSSIVSVTSLSFVVATQLHSCQSMSLDSMTLLLFLAPGVCRQ